MEVWGLVQKQFNSYPSVFQRGGRDLPPRSQEGDQVLCFIYQYLKRKIQRGVRLYE